MPSVKRALLAPVLAAAVTATAAVALSPQAASAHAASNFVQKVDNPYFPLTPGTTNVYTGERDGAAAVETFQVTHKTKKILGVRCTVVHDKLYLDGHLAEDTLDWYAQDKGGTVWYFGEDTKTLDQNGKVTSTEGSFQAGVDGARQGIFMPAHPKVGDSYQQEFYKGHAEDHFTILGLDEHVTVPAGTFDHAMLTKEWTPLEPDVVSDKNYVKGIGTVKEFDTQGGTEHLELLVVIHG